MSNIKHNGTTKHRKTKLYRIWQAMKHRCYYERNDNFKYYGGRGIRVCDDWRNSFAAFRDWALSSGYKDGLTLDRIDVDGDYCPKNCRWVSIAEQQRNRTDTHWIEYNGETHSIAEWAEITGISRYTLIARIRYGWTPEKALTKPVQKRKK